MLLFTFAHSLTYDRLVPHIILKSIECFTEMGNLRSTLPAQSQRGFERFENFDDFLKKYLKITSVERVSL